MTSAAIEEKIAACWRRGDSIGECRTAVHRATGVKPEAHEVQRVFASLSHLAWSAAA